MAVGEYSIGARWVVPVAGAPLHNARISVGRGVIREIKAEARGSASRDLGEVMVLPRLVNAHSHLEFSDLRRPLGQPGIGITQWIPQVIAARKSRSATMQNESVRLGGSQAARFGTVAIGDIVTSLPRPGVYDSIPLVAAFFERLGNDPSQLPQIVVEAQDFLRVISDSRSTNARRVTPGLSPHAPYSVHGDLFDKLVSLAAQHSLPVAMHLAESREEIEWLQSGRGPFETLLTALGAQRDPSDRNEFAKPLDYLQRLAPLNRVLIVHGNYLSSDELRFVASHRENLHVVYCPRTHAFFQHEPYPLSAMLDLGINVAVGTDSLASNPDLSVWRELTFVHQRHPHLEPATVLRLGTMNGARALGVDGHWGSLAAGKRADFLTLPIGDAPPAKPWQILFATNHEPQPFSID